MTTLEKMARAMCTAGQRFSGPLTQCAWPTCGCGDGVVTELRAALEALREPNNAVITAVAGALVEDAPGREFTAALSACNALITAILEEKD